MTASTWFDDLLAIKLRESIQSVCLNLIREVFSAVVFFGITWIQKVGWGKEVAGKTKGNQQKSTHPLSHFSFEPHPKETTDIRSDSSILNSNDGVQVLAYSLLHQKGFLW